VPKAIPKPNPHKPIQAENTVVGRQQTWIHSFIHSISHSYQDVAGRDIITTAGLGEDWDTDRDRGNSGSLGGQHGWSSYMNKIKRMLFILLFSRDGGLCNIKLNSP